MHHADIKFLRVLGCEAFVHKHGDERKKLDPASTRMVHVGYEAGAKVYQLYDLSTGKITVARDVTFIKSVFPFRHQQRTDSLPLEYPADDFWFPSPDDSTSTALSTASPADPILDSPIRAPMLCPLQI